MLKRIFASPILMTIVLATPVIMPAPPARSELAKEASIKTLMNRTGAGDIGLQILRQMMANMQKALPKVPKEFWSEFLAEFDADELEGLIIPIYQKHLTEEDVQALITFYETPAGKKFISVMPIVTKESMAAGQNWGEAVALRVVKKLKERGLLEKK